MSSELVLVLRARARRFYPSDFEPPGVQSLQCTSERGPFKNSSTSTSTRTIPELIPTDPTVLWPHPADARYACHAIFAG
jgi:hypothetical protein